MITMIMTITVAKLMVIQILLVVRIVKVLGGRRFADFAEGDEGWALGLEGEHGETNTNTNMSISICMITLMLILMPITIIAYYC